MSFSNYIYLSPVQVSGTLLLHYNIKFTKNAKLPFFFVNTLEILILLVFCKMTPNISGYIVLQFNSLDQSKSRLNLNPI